jgi:hypothetical protein
MILSAIPPMGSKSRLIDYYLECGFSGNFIALAGILFLWIAFICILPSADNSRSPYWKLLLPCSLLPVTIGIFGSSIGLHTALEYMQGPPLEGVTTHPAELLLPLIAGSLLSSVFIFLSIAIIVLVRFPRIRRRIQFAEQAVDGNPTSPFVSDDFT